MNSSKFEESTLRPTYMSQAEANEVMELWAERQREEAARQSLITIHDVAEATQLSTQDIERLLNEVRSGRPRNVERPRSLPIHEVRAGNEPTLMEAYTRVAPISGLIAVAMAIYISETARNYYNGYAFVESGSRPLAQLLWLYALVIAIVYGPKEFRDWQASRARQGDKSQRVKSRAAENE